MGLKSSHTQHFACLFLFFWALREAESKNLTGHFFSYVSQRQTLKPSLVFCGTRMNSFLTCSKGNKKTRANPYHPIPSSLSSFSPESASVSHLTTLLGSSWRSFSPPLPMEGRFYSGPCNLRWQSYWLYLTDWWMAKINKSSRRALRPSSTIHYN